MLLDYHIHLAMSRAPTLYLSDVAKFAALFPGISTAVTEVWRAELLASLPDVRIAGSQGVPKAKHIVVIRGQSGSPHSQFLGGMIGSNIYGAMETQRVEVEVLARTPETCLALHTICRAAVIAQRKVLLDDLYEDLSYDGFTGPTPQEEWAAEQGGFVVRWQSWQAIVQWKVPILTADQIPPLTWSVNLEQDGGDVEPVRE